MTSKYFVQLDRFEGPLDLLLYLIKENEIDIFDIDIFLLTTQYLSHLRLIQFDDLSDAGAFLEMAATLIEIKSRMLLPIEKSSSADGSDEDPRLPLQQRLIEYERYRNVANFLDELPQVGVEIQTSSEWSRLEPLYEDIEAPLTGDPATLVILYELTLKMLSERKHSKVEAKTHLVSVEEIIEKLDQLIEAARFSLFQGFYHGFSSRYEFVVYILAILELVKMKKLKVFQGEPLGPIWIYQSNLDESILPIHQKDDQPALQDASITSAASIEASVEMN